MNSTTEVGGEDEENTWESSGRSAGIRCMLILLWDNSTSPGPMWTSDKHTHGHTGTKIHQHMHTSTHADTQKQINARTHTYSYTLSQHTLTARPHSPSSTQKQGGACPVQTWPHALCSWRCTGPRRKRGTPYEINIQERSWTNSHNL